MESIEIILGLVIGIPLVILLILRGYNPVTERIAPRIVIQASPDNFVFEFRESRIQVEPFVYVRADNENIVTAIGQDFPNDPGIVRIDLFKCSSQTERMSDRARVLECFLRFGIEQVIMRSPIHFIMRYFVLRPVIIFRGLDTFAPLFCGYHRHIFDTLLKEQVVLTVLFE